MTNRISRLKTALFANTREISLERALLYTASHRQTPARAGSLSHRSSS